jgi:hypothetical protein
MMTNLASARQFSERGYRALIRSLRNLGYEDVFISQVDPEKSHVFLRHDVDLCPQRAADMARVEQEEGVRSTYYVLLNTQFYNVFAEEIRRALHVILACGHKIGLHFDAAYYPDDPQLLEEAVGRECAILEMAIEGPVESLSFHRPARALRGRPGLIAGRAHAYEPRFFSQLVYYADSQGCWRFGHPLDDERVHKARALQLVTHPIWWFQEGEGVVEKMEIFRQGIAQRARREMAENLTPFAQKFGIDGRDAPPL